MLYFNSTNGCKVMTRYLKTAFAAAAALLAASCISNDIPYPVVELRIANVEGEGFSVSENNVTSRVVTLTLDEATDIRNVKIDAVTYDAVVHSIELNKAELLDQVRSSQELTGTFNLLSPIYTTLSLYQDYDWTIRAVQTIERRFSVTGQIGATEIDTENRIVRVYVPDDTDLGHIEIEELKLGPAEITTYSPSLEELSGSSFESVRFVDVTCHGVTERWMLYVETTNVKVALREADLWQNTGTVTALISADEYASGAALEYRIKGDTEWQPMQESGYDAGILTATIAPEWKTETNPNGLTVYKLVPKKGLFAGHTYEFRLLVGGSEQGAPLEYTAPAGNTIPNGDMEDASMSCWTQNNKTAEFWGSGNNTFTKGLCTQASFAGGTRAKLQATSARGVLASGNLFTGLFQKDLITRGVVSFGQTYAWKARPRALKVQYFAEHIGPVDIDKKFGAPIGMGDQDRARIMVAIVDWNARREVGSGTEPPTGTWDPQEAASTEQGKIIAYGSLFIDESSTGDRMIDTELELHFYDREAKPSGLYQLVISCSTSAYGDFMTGCKSNVLYIDNFEWAY